MADNVTGGLPNRGETRHGGTPSSIGQSASLEGTTQSFRDVIRNGNQPDSNRSGRSVTAVLVRNSSGISLEPKRLVKWEAGYRGKRVDGYGSSTGEELAGIVDPFLPSSGVADDDLFWLIVKGPCLVKSSLAGNAENVIAEGEVLGALTAATSQATTAGRIGKVATASTALAASVILNAFGRAMSAKTTANTNADVLVDADFES